MRRPSPNTLFLFVLSLVISAAYFLYNLSILNRFLDHDIANYYMNVERRYLFNPHHLLFTTLSKLIYETAKARFGYDQPAMFLLQMLNLGTASIALGFLFFFLARLGRRTWLALTFTGLVGFSHGFWFYAHVNDTPAIPTSLALVTFLSAIFLVRNFDPRRPYLDWIKALSLGLLHTLAVGYHQKNVLLWVAVALLILFPIRWPGSPGKRSSEFFSARIRRDDDGERKPRGPHRRLLFLGIYTFTVTVFTASLYFWAGAVHHGYPLDDRKEALPGVPGGGNFFAWLFLYSHYSNNTWGNADQAQKTVLALRGSTNAFFKNKKVFWRRIVEQKGSQPRTEARTWWLAFANRVDFDEDRSPDIQITATLGGLLLLFMISLPLLFARLRILPVAALCWFGLYGALATWWEPLHFEHWVNASVGFWIAMYLLALGWLDFLNRGRIVHDAAYLVVVLSGAALAGLLWLTNYERVMLPQSRNIVFGHWEDFYLKSRFTGLLDGVVREPVYAVGENADRAWDKRVGRMHQLRAAMFTNDSDAHFDQNRWRFEKTVIALEDMFPDRPEVARFRTELNVMHAGRPAWLKYHGRSPDGEPLEPANSADNEETKTQNGE